MNRRFILSLCLFSVLIHQFTTQSCLTTLNPTNSSVCLNFNTNTNNTNSTCCYYSARNSSNTTISGCFPLPSNQIANASSLIQNATNYTNVTSVCSYSIIQVASIFVTISVLLITLF